MPSVTPQFRAYLQSQWGINPTNWLHTSPLTKQRVVSAYYGKGVM